MAINKKLDWLTHSTVKSENSFSSNKKHLYVDLNMDLKQSVRLIPNKNAILGSITTKQKDLEVIYDTDCILHSLYELFKTPKGARILVPEYGTKLYEYIGMHITTLLCSSIKETLAYDIKKWEPRVEVSYIDVTPAFDDSQINIKLFLDIPEINVKTIAQYKFDTKTGSVSQVK